MEPRPCFAALQHKPLSAFPAKTGTRVMVTRPASHLQIQGMSSHVPALCFTAKGMFNHLSSVSFPVGTVRSHRWEMGQMTAEAVMSEIRSTTEKEQL